MQGQQQLVLFLLPFVGLPPAFYFFSSTSYFPSVLFLLAEALLIHKIVPYYWPIPVGSQINNLFPGIYLSAVALLILTFFFSPMFPCALPVFPLFPQSSILP